MKLTDKLNPTGKIIIVIQSMVLINLANIASVTLVGEQ